MDIFFLRDGTPKTIINWSAAVLAFQVCRALSIEIHWLIQRNSAAFQQNRTATEFLLCAFILYLPYLFSGGFLSCLPADYTEPAFLPCRFPIESIDYVCWNVFNLLINYKPPKWRWFELLFYSSICTPLSERSKILTFYDQTVPFNST